MSLHPHCKNRWVYRDHLVRTLTLVRTTQIHLKQNKNHPYQFTERTTFSIELTEHKTQ